MTGAPLHVNTSIETFLWMAAHFLPNAPNLQGRFKIVETLGQGVSSSVFKAIKRDSAIIYAIKHLNKQRAAAAATSGEIRFRELQMLQQLHAHPSICSLHEVVRENDSYFLVLDYCETNLHVALQEGASPPAEATAAAIMQKLLSATGYAHTHHIIHRDLKPQNILVSRDFSVVKICDFGSARTGSSEASSSSSPPLTWEVGTLWYRAPEVLLRSPSYSSPVDMWAVGAILVEMLTLQPLFPGTSEVDQLHLTACVLGPLASSGWRDGIALDRVRGVQVATPPPEQARPLASVLRGASAEAASLAASLLKWDPTKRSSAKQGLRHPFVAARGAEPSSCSMQ